MFSYRPQCVKEYKHMKASPYTRIRRKKSSKNCFNFYFFKYIYYSLLLCTLNFCIRITYFPVDLHWSKLMICVLVLIKMLFIFFEPTVLSEYNNNFFFGYITHIVNANIIYSTFFFFFFNFCVFFLYSSNWILYVEQKKNLRPAI